MTKVSNISQRRTLVLSDGGAEYTAKRGELVGIAARLFKSDYPVALSQAIAAGTFLVGDFRGSAVIYDRWNARAEISTEDSDFKRNLITVLAEERLGLAVKRPTGFTKGTFPTAITDLPS